MNGLLGDYEDLIRVKTPGPSLTLQLEEHRKGNGHRVSPLGVIYLIGGVLYLLRWVDSFVSPLQSYEKFTIR